MSKVIERVQGQFVTETDESVMCNKCGCGYGIDDERFPEHRTYDGKSCKEVYGEDNDCTGTFRYEKREWTRRIPGYTVVKCDCGRKLNCSGFTSTCECGADYNWNGEQLAPRWQWGEETGESYSDIANGRDEE